MAKKELLRGVEVKADHINFETVLTVQEWLELLAIEEEKECLGTKLIGFKDLDKGKEVKVIVEVFPQDCSDSAEWDWTLVDLYQAGIPLPPSIERSARETEQEGGI